MKRIIDISSERLRVRARYNQLVLTKPDGTHVAQFIPEQLAVVMISNPGATISVCALQLLASRGAVLVTCERGIPSTVTLPLYGHFRCAERLKWQIAMTEPLRKRLWAQIVRHKIMNQGRLLKALNGDDAGLIAMTKTVLSGDSSNREAVAAKKYWAALFPNEDFKRDVQGRDNINAALNYGYGILRALTARAAISVGLNLSLGLFHKNATNPTALADDLMEPFRPVVDSVIASIRRNTQTMPELSPQLKNELIYRMSGRYDVDGRMEGISETTTKLAESLVRALAPTKLDDDEKPIRELNLPATYPLKFVSKEESVWLETKGSKLVETGFDLDDEVEYSDEDQDDGGDPGTIKFQPPPEKAPF